jgi:hypothetical protein
MGYWMGYSLHDGLQLAQLINILTTKRYNSMVKKDLTDYVSNGVPSLKNIKGKK